MSNSDLRRASEPIIRFFESHEIRYHIGGSVSSSAHGVPRTTIDVDFVADLKVHHVPKMVDEMQGAYYIDSGMIENAIRSESSFNLIHLETFIKLDVFVLKKSPYDQEVMARSVNGVLSVDDLEPLQVKFSSPEDIVLHKLHWFRLGGEQSERQWRDILGVLNVQHKTLDLSYMRSWARRIKVNDLFEQALSEINHETNQN
ncbi:MAG: hypothetical protein ACI9EW_003181 [Cellvibrionaceae bacterium]|jgi:hypothetical protein